jgi:hypothetical protein
VGASTASRRSKCHPRAFVICRSTFSDVARSVHIAVGKEILNLGLPFQPNPSHDRHVSAPAAQQDLGCVVPEQNRSQTCNWLVKECACFQVTQIKPASSRGAQQVSRCGCQIDRWVQLTTVNLALVENFRGHTTRAGVYATCSILNTDQPKTLNPCERCKGPRSRPLYRRCLSTQHTQPR